VPLIAVNDGWYIDVKISSSPSDRCRRLHPVDVVGDDVMEGDELESSAQPSSLHSSSASSSSSSSAGRLLSAERTAFYSIAATQRVDTTRA